MSECGEDRAVNEDSALTDVSRLSLFLSPSTPLLRFFSLYFSAFSHFLSSLYPALPLINYTYITTSTCACMCECLCGRRRGRGGAVNVCVCVWVCVMCCLSVSTPPQAWRWSWGFPIFSSTLYDYIKRRGLCHVTADVRIMARGRENSTHVFFFISAPAVLGSTRTHTHTHVCTDAVRRPLPFVAPRSLSLLDIRPFLAVPHLLGGWPCTWTQASAETKTW